MKAVTPTLRRPGLRDTKIAWAVRQCIIAQRFAGHIEGPERLRPPTARHGWHRTSPLPRLSGEVAKGDPAAPFARIDQAPAVMVVGADHFDVLRIRLKTADDRGAGARGLANVQHVMRRDTADVMQGGPCLLRCQGRQCPEAEKGRQQSHRRAFQLIDAWRRV